MALKIKRLAAIGALAATLAAGPALAQPTLSPQGGSAGPEMDHSRMGGGNMGGPAGGTITGNPGSGPDVRHGPAPTPAPAPAQRR